MHAQALATAARGSLPVPLTPEWLPAGGPEWLESRRRWHVGQLGAYERTLAALRTQTGGDYEGLAEDERLAATELLRIVTTIAGDLRMLEEPVARRVDCTDRTVWGVRRWLRLDPDQAGSPFAGVAGERSLTTETPCRPATHLPDRSAEAPGTRSVAA